MAARPTVIVFDVNETLSDMAPMAQRFADVGAPSQLAQLWFASLLRDGFALTAAGGQEKFAVVAEQVLRSVLAGVGLERDVDDAVTHVLSGLQDLDVHPDVPEGLRRLNRGGSRLVTLSNGATTVAESLLTRAGVRDEMEQLLSVEDAGAWKPAAAAYRYGAETLGVQAAEVLLVAVHPWDIDGAARAGLRTAWLDRGGARYPSFFTDPELTVGSLVELADLLDG